MPSGYTAKIVETEQSFRDFATSCARAFGACIAQRDDPFETAPAFQKLSEDIYYVNALDSDYAEFMRYYNMSIKDANIESLTKHQKTIAHAKEMIGEMSVTRERVQRMILKVENFVPPTPEHEEYKKFMLNQLIQTTDWDCNSDYYPRILNEKPLNGVDYRRENMRIAMESIEHHKKRLQENTTNMISRNDWIAQLMIALDKADDSI